MGEKDSDLVTAPALGECAADENNPYQEGRELVADYLCSSAEAFVQFLATNLLPHGYWFYVRGKIPDGKDRLTVDQKLLDRYGLNLSKWARARRRKKGEAKVRYLRYDAEFLLIATHGRHPFFEAEAGQIKDMRISPLKWRGYSISYKLDRRKGTWHSSVRMQLHVYLELKARVLRYAAKVQAPGWWYGFFWNMPYLSYAGINKQKFDLLRKVNRARKTSGFAQIDWEKAIKLKRKTLKVFLDSEAEATQVAKE